MAWITTKDGRRVNTDWFNEDEKKKYAQIEANREQVQGLARFNVPYDQWTHKEDITENHFEGDKPYTVHEGDQSRYVMDKDVRSVTKKSALDDIENWKNDDGTYGTGDEAIYVIYDDGKFLELTDGEPHSRWSKQGIRGISISTADYETVWGEEYYSKSKEWKPLTTHEFDEDSNVIPGYSNSYSGYKAVGVYNVRERQTVFMNERGHWQKKYETLQMSTVRPLGQQPTSSNVSAVAKVSNRLMGKGISTEWDITNYLRGLSPTRINRLAKELGIEGRGDLKIQLMVSKIYNEMRK